MKELPEYILCNSDIEFIECAKFLKKLGQTVVNFDGENFIITDKEGWLGFSFDHEDNYWRRFYTKKLIITNSIEFKYLARKDKLKKLRIMENESR